MLGDEFLFVGVLLASGRSRKLGMISAGRWFHSLLTQAFLGRTTSQFDRIYIFGKAGSNHQPVIDFSPWQMAFGKLEETQGKTEIKELHLIRSFFPEEEGNARHCM